MPRKRHSPEQILGKLREVEVALAKGQTVAVAVRQIPVNGPRGCQVKVGAGTDTEIMGGNSLRAIY